MKPIRSEHTRKLNQDPWHGVEKVQLDQRTLHALDNEEIKSFVAVKDVACGCGCLRSPGGYCAVCKPPSLICHQCFGHCVQCSKPVCGKHSKMIHGKRLCRNCKGDNVRKSFMRMLFSPFIQYEDEPKS